jgi:beta-lactam-binding protein with PASTA domain
MDSENKIEDQNKLKYFGTYRRIALVLFLAFTLFLTVSSITLIFLTKSEKEIKIPDVTGKRFIEIHNRLVRIGLRPDIKFRDLYDIDDGVILHQSPKAGSVVVEKSKINLLVSRSKIFVTVPNLIGKELPIAYNKLKNLHYHGKRISISAGVVSYIPSETSADNIIISQNPIAGVNITPDQKINLLVSIGTLKADKKMPHVQGQSIDLCYDLLLAKGLIVNEEIVETVNMKKSGEILSQSIKKNSIIGEKASVKLKVYWYPLKEHPYSAYEKIEYKIPGNFKSGVYEVIIEDNFSKRIRFSKVMKPGQKIKFIFHRIGNSKITFMKDKKEIRITTINVEEYR